MHFQATTIKKEEQIETAEIHWGDGKLCITLNDGSVCVIMI
jgi:hypothetical protein